MNNNIAQNLEVDPHETVSYGLHTLVYILICVDANSIYLLDEVYPRHPQGTVLTISINIYNTSKQFFGSLSTCYALVPYFSFFFHQQVAS